MHLNPTRIEPLDKFNRSTFNRCVSISNAISEEKQVQKRDARKPHHCSATCEYILHSKLFEGAIKKKPD